MRLFDSFSYGIEWFIEGIKNGDWSKIIVGVGFVIVGVIAIKYLFAAVNDLNKGLSKEPNNKVNRELKGPVQNNKVEKDYKNTLSYKAGKLYVRLFKKR